MHACARAGPLAIEGMHQVEKYYALKDRLLHQSLRPRMVT
jgi:hypothetical protein